MSAADRHSEFDTHVAVLRRNGTQLVAIVVGDRLRGSADEIVFYRKTEMMDLETGPGHAAEFCCGARALYIVRFVA